MDDKGILEHEIRPFGIIWRDENLMANIKDRRCRDMQASDDECHADDFAEGVKCSLKEGHDGSHHAHGCILRWGAGDYFNLRREERLKTSFIPRPGSLVVISFDEKDSGCYDQYDGEGRIGDVAVVGEGISDIKVGDRVVFVKAESKFYNKGQDCYVVKNEAVMGKWSLSVGVENGR